MSVYVVGTAKRLPYGSSPADRIRAYSIRTPGGCWLWQGALNTKGYAVLSVGGRGGRRHYAHRLSYEIHVGPIPAGLQIDHLCRVRRCVNPAHLEPVTNRENVLRGIAARQLEATT